MSQKDCPYSLTSEDWASLEEVHSFLQPFYEATMRLQQDSATLDQALYVLDALRKHLENSKKAYATNLPLLAAITTCWYAFDKWYAAVDVTPVYAAAVLLHP